MMDPRMSALTVRLQHRHNDGSWSDLTRKAHDPASNDPERGWNDAELYVCTSCEEEVRVTTTQPGQPTGR
jgi:hypothetical protein